MRLFDALVDDAGLFPPEELAMPAALARYREDRAAGEPVLTGRFLCPAAALDRLAAELRPDDEVAVGLIAPLDETTVRAAVRTIAAQPGLTLASVEGTAVDSVRGALAGLWELGVPSYVELPVRDPEAALDVLAAAGVGAKVRCGGLRAELFPGAAELGAFLVACVERSMPVKATAGLHHAVRHTDPTTGFTHHGFLNLVVAVSRAVAGGDPVEALRSTDAAALAAEARGLDDEQVARTRAVLRCYGSCSTSEPPADLRALGLLAGAAS